MGIFSDFVSDDTLNSIKDISSQVIFYLGIILMIAIILYNMRFIMRYLYHLARQAYLGPMVWNEVVYVGAVNEEELIGSVGLMDNMEHIMLGTTGRIFGFINWRRPLVSIMIRKDSEDDSVHMYIGIDSRNYNKDYVQAWAQGSNCSIEEIPFEEIGFVSNAPFTAIVDNYTPSRFTNSPTKTSVGGVISRIQDMTRDNESGTILFTYEPMITTEQNLLEDHINTENSSDSVYTRVRDQVELFTGLSPSRGVAIGFSDDGNMAFSESMLKTSLNSLPNKGFDEDRRRYTDLQRRTGVFSIIPTVLIGIASYFNILPLWVGITTAVFTAISLLGLPILSSYWISLAASKGAAPIPPFRRMSPRRYFGQWWHNNFTFRGRSNAREQDNNPRAPKYVGRPSTEEVMPFYQTSLMQLASMPQRAGGATNISKSVIPQVALPASVNASEKVRRFIKAGDVIYEGISARSNEPVYHTLIDVNFGVAFGGDAGSGKTNALMNHFMGVSRLSRKTTGIMGKNIKNSTDKPTINPIWFESKADDLNELIGLVKEYDPLVLSLHNLQQQDRLALEGGRLGDEGITINKIEENKNVLIASMQSVWGESFGPQSKRVADCALMIAYLLDREGLDKLHFTNRLSNPERPNIIHLMHLLINGDASLNVKKSLIDYANSKRDIINNPDVFNEYKAQHSQEEIQRLKVLLISLDGLINLYDVPNAVAPLQNKLPQLMKSKGLFETVDSNGNNREEFDLDRLFNYGGPVIVDMTPNGSNLAPDDTRIFIMMVHYLLWQKIRMKAGGWGRRLKFTPIYADEITNFTGRAEDKAPCATIIGEVRDQGRSYGVSHNVGFQNFGQLPNDVRNSILSFTSKIFFKFGNRVDQEEVIKQMSIPQFTEANVRSFPQGVGIAQLSINNVVCNEFIIKTPYAKTWGESLRTNEDIEMAFESIKDDEIAMMKREKKKKVDSNNDSQVNSRVNNHNDDYEDENIDDIFKLNDIDDDRPPRMSWGGES